MKRSLLQMNPAEVDSPASAPITMAFAVFSSFFRRFSCSAREPVPRDSPLRKPRTPSGPY